MVIPPNVILHYVFGQADDRDSSHLPQLWNIQKKKKGGGGFSLCPYDILYSRK